MSLDFCNEVGDPKKFYFIYPAESSTGAYLDINDTVKRDNGRTPVCMLYLTHMLGQERSVDMMTNKKLREQHLFVLKMANYQGKGFDAVVLRYSDIPFFNKAGEAINPIMRLFLTLMLTLGLTLTVGSGMLLFSPDNEEHPLLLLLLGLGLVALGIPARIFTKEVENAEAVKKNEIDRSRALESRLMGIKFQKWQEPLLALEPRAVTAGRQAPHKSKKSRQSKKNRHIAHTHRRNENEFRRLKSQSLEATVAGAAPRTYRAR